MSNEDDDLEKAGTRSRRQLTNSKQYSVYPPENHASSFGSTKYTSRRWIKSKSIHVFIFLILLFIYFSFNTTTYLSSSSSQLDFEESVHFNDSTQLTDYTNLLELINEKKDVKQSTFQFNVDNLKDGQDSFTFQLAKGTIQGHTFDELRRLTNSVSLGSKNNKLVPVTAIIHTNQVTQLYAQLQAVLTQTALPEQIWIICNTDDKLEVEARIMTLDRKRVRVVAMDNVLDDSDEWLKSMAYAATDFVWLIDQNIAPGKRYLENMLKLSSTPQYRSALLGTEGATLDLNSKDIVECIPDTIHSSSTQMKSQVVDMINDNWLIYRSWVPYLLEALDKRSSSAANADMNADQSPFNAFTGLFISKTLYSTIGIPSIAIPTDPIERAYWGDVRLQKAQKSETCKALEETTKELNLASKLISQDILYRGQMATQDEPILFYVDSMEEFENLAPLICKFESTENIGLHIVTSGVVRGISDHEIKTSLPSKCNIEQPFSANAIIHDIGVLHESTTYNLANDLLHRFTRILSVVQPRVLIHSMDKSNSDLYSSIKASMDIIQVPEIYLPVEDIPHTLWMTELPPHILSKWNSFSIKVLITTDKKPHALARLLTSATNAHYMGDQVDLTVFMDHGSDRVTQALVNNYNWKKGVKRVNHRIAPVPRSSIFSETWYPSSNNEYAIIISDEVELSPFYYIWAKYAILQYRYHQRDEHLFGVSLYAPRIIETDPQGRRLFEPKLNDTQAYLMQWPSYSGAVYFPEQWREFHDYITARLADTYGYGMQDIMVNNLRSNEWNKSWRRYFEELVYLRGYVMLFPNFDSLSTIHVELKKKILREQYVDAVSLYNVDLLKNNFSDIVLPDYSTLPVFDIWGKPASMGDLELRGLELHEEISSCVPPMSEEERRLYDATDLLCPFARIVSVALEKEDDEIPELPIKQVDVYS